MKEPICMQTKPALGLMLAMARDGASGNTPFYVSIVTKTPDGDWCAPIARTPEKVDQVIAELRMIQRYCWPDYKPQEVTEIKLDFNCFEGEVN